MLAFARRLHQEWPFDLIHAHFIYPDGVVASQIGRELGVPVMTSEHAFLGHPGWLDQPKIGAQVAAALPGILQLVTAVSNFLRPVDRRLCSRTRRYGRFADRRRRRRLFARTAAARYLDELLYVGLILKFKRIEMSCWRALAEARRILPRLHLRILSSNAFRA